MDIERDLEFARKCVMVSNADIVTKTRVDETLKAIARQSVTDEDVREAIDILHDWNVENIHDPTVGLWQDKEMAQAIPLAITALQQMQKTQELEKENQGLKKTIEDMQRNLDAWNPRQSFNEPTTGNPVPQTSYTTSINKTDLADGKLR